MPRAAEAHPRPLPTSSLHMEAESDISNLCRKECFALMSKHILYLLKPLVYQLLLSYMIQYLISHGPEVQMKYSILVFYTGLLFSLIILLKQYKMHIKRNHLKELF